MNLEFKKISYTPKFIDILLEKAAYLSNQECIHLSGYVTRFDSHLVKFVGDLQARLNLVCVLSGDEFFKDIKEHLVLYFSDGIWRAQSQTNINSLDVIEFFDGLVDFLFIIESEIELIRLDYNVKE